MYTTLIELPQFAELLDSGNPLVLDCSFALGQPDWGRQEYLKAHIPGAIYVDLEKDLSGPPITDCGRHPMPSAEALLDLFSRLGVSAGRQVLAYDQQQGAMASRLWWLLKYMGHDAVAVLNGGIAAWRREGRREISGEEQPIRAQFAGQARRDRLITIDQLDQVPLLIDARAAKRFRGEVEPLYAIPGRIPGSKNCPYDENIDANGMVIESSEIRAKVSKIIGDVDENDVVYSCGSGVTACHLLLTSMYSGLAEGKVYIGSYSEWLSDPSREIATGNE